MNSTNPVMLFLIIILGVFLADSPLCDYCFSVVRSWTKESLG